MELPPWVAKHRGDHIEIHRRGDHYYAYRIGSTYDAKLGRSRKVTHEYLGKVTREGIVPARHKRPSRVGGILEAGPFVFLERFVEALRGPVLEAFPEDGQSLLAAATLKLCHKDPLGRLQLRYETSLAKRLWPEAALSKDSLTGLVRRIGVQWSAQRDVFRALARDEKHMAIDLSHVFSDSEHIPWLEYGHNGDDVWRPQLQVLLCWGTTSHRPGFLKLLPGATNSAQTLANTVAEAPLKDVIVVVDKGFWSPQNVTVLEEAEVHYAMALKRDLPLVDHAPPSAYRNHFLYRKHAQWWRKTEWKGRTVYHYLDKTVADQEESALLERVDQGKATRADYEEARRGFGTLSILTDTGLSAEETYGLYRERREVEYAFDAFQNALGADVTWMRSRDALTGYYFILFLSLHLYSQVLDHLKRKQLLSTYSVADVLAHLSKVSVVEVDGKDRLGEVTRQTQTVIDRLEVPITQKLGL